LDLWWLAGYIDAEGSIGFPLEGRPTVQVRNTHQPTLLEPFASVLDDPYAWLDRLQAQTHTAMVICLREPVQRFAEYRQRGYAAMLPEPCARQDLIDLIASVGVPD
jgi:hypothetical protein